MKSALVVEDELVISEEIKCCLEKCGYEVIVQAKGGQEVSQLPKWFYPSIAIIDFRLSGVLSGVDVASELQKRYQATIVFLTAMSHKRINALVNQDFEYIHVDKPFDSKSFLKLIDKIS